MKHGVLHARFGSVQEFADPDAIIPAGIVCIVQGEDGMTDSLKIGDGVNTYLTLPVFTPTGGAGMGG